MLITLLLAFVVAMLSSYDANCHNRWDRLLVQQASFINFLVVALYSVDVLLDLLSANEDS